MNQVMPVHPVVNEYTLAQKKIPELMTSQTRNAKKNEQVRLTV
jgi:hypothetical protein